MVIKPDLSKGPKDATHWAPETDKYLECWYRLEAGLWYCVNAYWGDDVDERPYGMPAKAWKTIGKPTLDRPTTDLIPVSELR